MTAGAPPNRLSPPSRHDKTSRSWFKHSSADRVNTDAVMVDSLRSEYPQLHLTVIPEYNCNLIGWASAGHAGLAPIDQEKDRLSWRVFLPPADRLGGGGGALGDEIQFGKYLLDWQGREYVVYVVNGRDGSEPYPQVTNQYVSR